MKRSKPSKSIKVFAETSDKLDMLKRLTSMPKSGLMDTAINLMVNQFKKTGTLEFRK